MIERLAVRLFRRHIRGRPHHGTRTREVNVLVRGAGQAKVEELDAAVGRFQPDVRGLDVAVNQPLLVRRRQPPRGLVADPQHLERGQASRLLEAGIQRFAAKELQRQKRHATILADLINRDDVIVLDLRRGAGLAEEPLRRVWIRGQFGPHHLDRDLTLQVRVFGAEHQAHPALAQNFEDSVAAEAAEFARLQRWPQEPEVRRCLAGGFGVRVRALQRGIVCEIQFKRHILEALRIERLSRLTWVGHGSPPERKSPFR